MSSRTRIDVGRVLRLAVGCWLVLGAGCGSLVAGEGRTYNGTVAAVADGDTVDVRLANGSVETVRLLGVDAPEVYSETSPGEFAGVPDTDAGRRCLRAAGEAATAFLRERIDGERVRVETDPLADRRGDYGRLLAYLSAGNRSLNYALLARGHARVYRTGFGERARFEQAAASARVANRGLWRCRGS